MGKAFRCFFKIVSIVSEMKAFVAGEAGDEKGRLTFIGSANALPSYKKFSKWKIQCRKCGL